MPEFQHYIDGRFEHAERTFESIDPATQTPWARMPRAGADDVDRAVNAAHRSLTDPDWAVLTATQPGRLSLPLADRLHQASS